MSTQPQSAARNTPQAVPLAVPNTAPQPIALRGVGKEALSHAPESSPERQAHALRNWLTVLRVHCDLLEQAGAVAERHRGWLQELSVAIGRGESLIAGLLPTLAATRLQTSAPLPALSSSKSEPHPAAS